MDNTSFDANGIADKKKIKIFCTPWHLWLAHQYDLMKALEPFAELYFLIQYQRPYNEQPRGDFIKNWVTHYEPGVYDLAILHLDNQCTDQQLWNRGKGRVYRDLNNVIQDIPKIVLNHGTPYYPEKYDNDIKNDTFAKNGISSKLIDEVKKAIGDNHMVVNSHMAQKQWGWGNVIVHGMDSSEWWNLPKEPRVITMISSGGLDQYYDRVLLSTVKDRLAELGINHCHITVDYMPKSWNDYRNFIGRSLVYFNPTRESPMPRSRTEAMLSGCCVVTTKGQDAESFIVDGVNGFLTPRNPDAIVERIVWALNNYHLAVKIGQNARITAEHLFSRERYREDWRLLLSKVLNREIK